MYCPSDSPSNVASENQKSPVFIQWLDAVYQIMHQNITKFEFNTDLLYFLANEIFTGKYGTFLFNNEKEREMYDAENIVLKYCNTAAYKYYYNKKTITELITEKDEKYYLNKKKRKSIIKN